MPAGVRIAACIPTKDRPESVRTLLANLSDQVRPFDVVLVVDSSDSDLTRNVTEERQKDPGSTTFEYVHTRPGLPWQRLVGIETLRKDQTIAYICFLDDDVVLEPSYAATIVAFMESDAGRPFGGVSGYETHWGVPFDRVQRAFHRIGVYDGELRPGRWLYSGSLLQLEHLEPHEQVFECEFLPGFQAVWRTEVFDHFTPPIGLPGYALGEDKHLSLRVGTRYKLGVVSATRTTHLHAEGGRPKRFKQAIQRVRSGARLLRECDPSPRAGRYAAFLGVTLLETIVMFVVRIAKGQVRDLVPATGTLVGWFSCMVAPPRRSPQALHRPPARRAAVVA